MFWTDTHLNTRKNYTQCINDDSTNINKAINTSLIFDTNVANGKNEYYYSNHQEISMIWLVERSAIKLLVLIRYLRKKLWGREKFQC